MHTKSPSITQPIAAHATHTYLWGWRLQSTGMKTHTACHQLPTEVGSVAELITRNVVGDNHLEFQKCSTTSCLLNLGFRRHNVLEHFRNSCHAIWACGKKNELQHWQVSRHKVFELFSASDILLNKILLRPGICVRPLSSTTRITWYSSSSSKATYLESHWGAGLAVNNWRIVPCGRSGWMQARHDWTQGRCLWIQPCLPCSPRMHAFACCQALH